MEANINKAKKWLYVVLVCTLYTLQTQGQVQNNDLLYIGDNEVFYIASGTYNFGNTPASTQTTRSTNNGTLLFGTGASAANASNNHSVNGYTSYTGNAQFILPTGNASTYAPIAVQATAVTTIDAAYFEADPGGAIGTATTTDVVALSDSEYWNVKSTATATDITLTWRADSDVSTLTDDNLNDLIIAGWNGTQWVELTSEVDFQSILGSTSTINAGSITAEDIDLTTYSNFTLGAKQDGCAPIITASGTTKTWNGASWSPSAPNLADDVVINGAYSGTLQCNALVLNADITITGNEYVEIVRGVTGTGKININGNASIVQRDATATGPTIAFTRTTGPKRRYDFVYWGTPVSGNFLSQIDNASAQDVATTGAFSQKFKYVSGVGGGWQTLDAITTGRGFITRVKSQAPFVDDTTTDNIDLPINGTANNGDITVSIARDPAAPNAGRSHNLLANPYPSAIDAGKLLRENTDLDGAIYFWTASTPNDVGYVQSDYAIWNLAGEVGTSPSGQLPTGKIASGQGFKIKSLADSGNVTFTNCMRVTEDNDNFFRMSTSQITSIDRYKLTMTGGNDIFSQIQIGYLPEATQGYDRLLDAGRNSVSTAKLYSFIDEQKIAINSKPEFEVTDIVPIGVSKGSDDQGSFTISLHNKEGVFNTGDVSIYLHDTALNVYHNLALGDYSFTVTEAQTNNRFEIVYHLPTLGGEDFMKNQTIASIADGRLNIQSEQPLKTVTVFDIAGRYIMTITGNAQTKIQQPFRYAAGVYIVRIESTTGAITGTKLINARNN